MGVAACALMAVAGEVTEDLSKSVIDDLSGADRLFQEDRWEFSLAAGANHSSVFESNRTDFDYALASIRFGWMLDSVTGEGWTRGNWEFMMCVEGGGIFGGPGEKILPGPSFYVVYNFVQPGWDIVPYAGFGGGFLWPDSEVEELGQNFNFTPQGFCGFRYLIHDKWSVNLEFHYHHMSSAGISKRNTGIDGIGGMLGVSYFFE